MKIKHVIIIIIILTFMSINIWESLPKNQTDSQTILEAIAELIAEHENDPDAHNLPDQSLSLHRVNSIIDHPAGSVKNDKGSFDIFDYQNYFSDFSAWTINSGFTVLGDGTVLLQVANANGTFYVYREFSSNFINMSDDYSKTFSIEALLICSSWDNDQKFRLGVGNYQFTSNYFFGFQIEGNILYAVAYKTNNTQYRFEIENFDPLDTNKHAYFVRYDASQKILYWYIDNNLVNEVSTESESISTYIDPYILLSASLDNLGTYEPEFYFHNPRFSVDYTY